MFCDLKRFQTYVAQSCCLLKNLEVKISSVGHDDCHVCWFVSCFGLGKGFLSNNMPNLGLTWVKFSI